KKIMYTDQKSYEQQLRRLGITSDDDYTCACYLDEVGNKPGKGDVLSWAESSAVVYANSVLGARCNRNSAVIDIMGSIVGYVPAFGFVTDEGRKATWIVEVRTEKKPEAQLLGSAIGMKVMEEVPYVVGLDKWIGTELNDEAKSYLKDFGAATASNGAVGLYHIDGVTPEAVESGRSLIAEDAKVYVIDDAELQRVYDNYPIVWKKPDSDPTLCFIGCPHLSLSQLNEWRGKISAELAKRGLDKLTVPTVFTAAPGVIESFKRTAGYWEMINRGAIISYICPLMYMNNPLCASKPVITCSNKLRTYTTARFYTEEEILRVITGGEA
ncbi:MAG: DUF521 domain-containing protein, partial [Firmicutes bacterium]|nr:DUF521 domain-containing protein [Bacillota bacterium]